MMKKYIILFIFTCLVLVGKSQNLTGTVVDVNRNAVVGATVVVFDSTFNDICATDALGKFRIENCPDRVSVKITCIGFEPFIQVISMSELTNRHLPILLKISVTRLDEAIVKAQPPVLKKELGKFVMTNVAQLIIAKGNNAYTFLNYVPVLNITSKGITILNRDQPAIIYINGPVVNIPLQSIPAKNIDKIEIIAIPAATQSASNRQGIVNIVLWKQLDEGVKTTVSLSSRQSYYNS